MLMCTRVLRLASVCALRLPTTSSAEVPAAGTHNIKRASPDALGQHGRRNTDQKDQLYFASRSIRQWRGQASLTYVSRVSNSCLRRKSPTRKTFGVCASACDQRHLRRPERSPLHDVRQHARRCLVGQPAGEFVFSHGRDCDRQDRRTGGARRDRTDDLLLAKQALSQLSYGPAVTAPKQKREWWAWEDLNFRPHAYQARALTN